jgi:hypothetical protein
MHKMPKTTQNLKRNREKMRDFLNKNSRDKQWGYAAAGEKDGFYNPRSHVWTVYLDVRMTVCHKWQLRVCPDAGYDCPDAPHRKAKKWEK